MEKHMEHAMETASIHCIGIRDFSQKGPRLGSPYNNDCSMGWHTHTFLSTFSKQARRKAPCRTLGPPHAIVTGKSGHFAKRENKRRCDEKLRQQHIPHKASAKTCFFGFEKKNSVCKSQAETKPNDIHDKSASTLGTRILAETLALVCYITGILQN